MSDVWQSDMLIKPTTFHANNQGSTAKSSGISIWPTERFIREKNQNQVVSFEVSSSIWDSINQRSFQISSHQKYITRDKLTVYQKSCTPEYTMSVYESSTLDNGVWWILLRHLNLKYTFKNGNSGRKEKFCVFTPSIFRGLWSTWNSV